MMLDDTQRVILLLGIEDRCGLWEITRERGLYDKTREEQIQLASRALKSLLAQGLVRLYRRGDQDVEIGLEESERILSNRSSWCVPKAGLAAICFEATPSGEEVYWDTVDR